MTDTDLPHLSRAIEINSEHFRRTKAEKLRTVNSGELRDVNAEALQKMYQTDEVVSKG